MEWFPVFISGQFQIVGLVSLDGTLKLGELLFHETGLLIGISLGHGDVVHVIPITPLVFSEIELLSSP
jgi:hypothetical protein